MLCQIFYESNFGFGNDISIEYHSHSFRTLCYRDTFKCIQFVSANLPFQSHLAIEPARLAYSESHWIYSEINMGDSWWDTQDQLPAGATIFPAICALDKTHFTNVSGDQNAWPLYLCIGKIQKNICQTHKQAAWIAVQPNLCHPKGAKNRDVAWHFVTWTMLSPLWNLDITSSGLEWNCAVGFLRQCYHLLAARVRDYPVHMMIAQVTYGSWPMCQLPKGASKGYSTCRALDNWRDRHIYSELQNGTDIDVLHTLYVHPIRNQFWQFPVCNVCQLWQPDELHQLLLDLVEDLLHWLLKYLKARNVKNQFDSRFTLVPQYLGLQCFSKPFNWMKGSAWQGKLFSGMIRTLAVNWAPILDYTKDDGKTPVETASDEMVEGAMRASCEFSLLVSQQHYSDLSLRVLDDAL